MKQPSPHLLPRLLKSGNLETVLREVQDYLESLPPHFPNALPPLPTLPPDVPDDLPNLANPCISPSAPMATTNSSSSSFYVNPTDPHLAHRIHGFTSTLMNHPSAAIRGIEKSEMLMLINCRPESQAELYLVIEDVETRLSEEEMGIVLGVVKEWWGGSGGGRRKGGGRGGGEGAEAAEDGYEEAVGDGEE
ncbi:hypothetical protein BDZ91DRAFT_785015 [Kalaharituber pfeilii]|nr:hypothetical protein BDZ91DRAFT_785015 [Kalaharituber pfeilii]